MIKKEDDFMKKMFIYAFLIGFLIILLFAISACREKTEEKATETISEDDKATVFIGEGDGTIITEETEDVDANEQPFVQTDKETEEVTLTITGAEPSTIVVDFGDLVTLKIYSERLKPTQLYNEDLHLDQTIKRGETVDVVVETNEEGIFYLFDKNTNESLIRFMVAGTSFG